MNEKIVLLIKSNLISEETKRPKIAKLMQAYRIIAISWYRGSRGYIKPSHGSNRVEEVILNFPSPFGIRSVLYLPIWWIFIFYKLMTMEWNLAHVINFDSIIPTILAGKLRKKPIIYEILDVYIDQVVLPCWLRNLGIMIDKIFIRFADAIIIADELQIEEMSGIPNSKIIPIYDSPDEDTISYDLSIEKNRSFTLFFAGVLDSARRLNLDNLIYAIKDIKNVELIIAGYGDLVNNIENYAYQMPDKIKFIGSISHGNVIKLSSNADLLFVLRDPLVPVNKYICGSKLLEAMACSKPILVNKGTSTARKVLQEDCGLVIDANDIDEIRDAIIKLRDNPVLCKHLGFNARRAYVEKYSFDIMKKRLLELYRALLEEHAVKFRN